MSPITVTFEQDGKRATVTLTRNDKKKTLEVSAKWEPVLNREKPQEKDFFVFEFLKLLRGQIWQKH